MGGGVWGGEVSGVSIVFKACAFGVYISIEEQDRIRGLLCWFVCHW